MLLQEIKTYTLSCTYLGVTAEALNLSASDLECTTCLTDVESAFPGDVWKWSGNQLTDGHGSFTEPSPLKWARAVATETGICSEGLSASGHSLSIFQSINALLEAAECSERLVMLDSDGEPTTDESEADWGVTFDTEHANKDVLAELDSAEWEVEETGLNAKALLDALKSDETVYVDASEDDGDEAVTAAIDAAEAAGYIHLAQWGVDNDEFYEIDNHGAGSEESFAALANIAGVKTLTWQERKNAWADYLSTRADYFCQREDLERVVREFEADPAIFSAFIEEAYQVDAERELVTEEEFEAYAKGDDTDFVIFEGDIYTKAQRSEGDWCLYRRTGEREWAQQ